MFKINFNSRQAQKLKIIYIFLFQSIITLYMGEGVSYDIPSSKLKSTI